MESVFTKLNAINCNEHTEQKNGLTYLSWAWAWQIAKTNYPDATFTIYEWTNAMGCPQNYFTDGRTAWVKTGVTIEGIEYIEELPVMDFKNRSIGIDNITSMDVNKAIQRSLTKALARHGLGLYIYAGEDLPNEADDEARKAVKVVPITERAKKAEAEKEIDMETYWKFVKAQAEGQTTPSGKSAQMRWCEIAKPTITQLEQFEEDVRNYQSK